MKRSVLALFCALALMPFSPAIAESSADPQQAVDAVRHFYTSLQDAMNTADYDTALSIIDRHFADDFLHYDDGEVSYGKDGMILSVEGYRDNGIRSQMDIQFTDIMFAPEESEVTALFHIAQKFYTRDNDTGEEREDVNARILLECIDSLHFTDVTDFALYRCNCVRQSTIPEQAE